MKMNVRTIFGLLLISILSFSRSSYLFMSCHEIETLKPYHPLELKLEILRLKKSLALPALVAFVF
jgi:hypothetical protein